MKNLQTVLCISVLTLAICSTAVAGTITGSRTNSAVNFTGSNAGTITGSSPGTITGSSFGTITGSRGDSLGAPKEEPQMLFGLWLLLLTIGL